MAALYYFAIQPPFLFCSKIRKNRRFCPFRQRKNIVHIVLITVNLIRIFRKIFILDKLLK